MTREIRAPLATEFWRGRRVLVTGGAGFIGTHLATALANAGAIVRVVDDLSRGRRENLAALGERIDLQIGDLRDPATALAASAGIDTVFHLAAKVGSIGDYLRRPSEIHSANILIDAQTFAAALTNGAQRYVYASSAHVYPMHLQTTPDAPALKESDAFPADPAISYGWAKLTGENQLRFSHEQGAPLRSAIARVTGAYGEGQDIELETASAIPAFCRRALEYPRHGPLRIFGDGTETRSYCHVSDVVKALAACAEKLDDAVHLGPLNIGCEGRASIREILDTVIVVSGKAIEVETTPARNGGIVGQAIDVAEARRQLPTWRPEIDLASGIARVYRDVGRRLGLL